MFFGVPTCEVFSKNKNSPVVEGSPVVGFWDFCVFCLVCPSFDGQSVRV